MRGVRVRAYKRVRRIPFYSIRVSTKPSSVGLPADLHAPVDLNLLRHELRTPLTGLLGLAEMLSIMDLPGRASCWLATLQACGQHLASLIDRTLRAEQDSMVTAHLAGTESRSLLQRIICSHWPAAVAGQIKLHLIFQVEADGHWQIDPVALRQALDNLLANAIRFTRSGYVTLEARVIPGLVQGVDQGVDSLQLIVEDSGLGLQAVHNNLRDCAEFADRTYPLASRGHGLQVVEQLCLDQGGWLDRYANTAGGAGFAMLLPGVLRNRDKGIKPFQFGLFKRLHCLLWLEKPLDRVVMALLSCLDIHFEVAETSQYKDGLSLSPWQIAICHPFKWPAPVMSADQTLDAASVWLMAPMATKNATELHAQALPEPLFLMDLQNALLRCLVMQGIAAEKFQETVE